MSTLKENTFLEAKGIIFQGWVRSYKQTLSCTCWLLHGDWHDRDKWQSSAEYVLGKYICYMCPKNSLIVKKLYVIFQWDRLSLRCVKTYLCVKCVTLSHKDQLVSPWALRTQNYVIIRPLTFSQCGIIDSGIYK